MDAVRFGSKDDMCAAKGHVCFTLESGHVRCTSLRMLWAIRVAKNPPARFTYVWYAEIVWPVSNRAQFRYPPCGTAENAQRLIWQWGDSR
jgi:hypothetical protein